MKHLFTYIFLLFSTAVFAQPGGDGKKEQKIQALYVAYITQELKLTEEEAQKFWPVHAQYDNEIKALKSESSELERQQSVLNIKKKYQDRFTKILGAQRTNDFYIKDGEFRKKLIERLRNMRQQNMMRQQNFKQGPLQRNPNSLNKF
jgi:Skp family chaperone for outer membrane proteins